MLDWRKSLARAEELGMPYEQGLAHFEIGRHLQTSDPRRHEHLAHAIDIFTVLDACWDLERVQEVIALSMVR